MTRNEGSAAFRGRSGTLPSREFSSVQRPATEDEIGQELDDAALRLMRRATVARDQTRDRLPRAPDRPGADQRRATQRRRRQVFQRATCEDRLSLASLECKASPNTSEGPAGSPITSTSTTSWTHPRWSFTALSVRRGSLLPSGACVPGSREKPRGSSGPRTATPGLQPHRARPPPFAR